MLGLRRCFVAGVLVFAGCGDDCERFAEVYCEATGGECAGIKATIGRAELARQVCADGVQAVADFSKIGGETRSVALAALLRDALKKSPKLTAAEIDAAAPPMTAPVQQGAAAVPMLVMDPSVKFERRIELPDVPPEQLAEEQQAAVDDAAKRLDEARAAADAAAKRLDAVKQQSP